MQDCPRDSPRVRARYAQDRGASLRRRMIRWDRFALRREDGGGNAESRVRQRSLRAVTARRPMRIRYRCPRARSNRGRWVSLKKICSLAVRGWQRRGTGRQRRGRLWPSGQATLHVRGSRRKHSPRQLPPTARRRRNLSRRRRAAGKRTSCAGRAMNSGRRDKALAFHPCRFGAPAGRPLSTRLLMTGNPRHGARLAFARPALDRSVRVFPTAADRRRRRDEVPSLAARTSASRFQRRSASELWLRFVRSYRRANFPKPMAKLAELLTAPLRAAWLCLPNRTLRLRRRTWLGLPGARVCCEACGTCRGVRAAGRDGNRRDRKTSRLLALRRLG